MTLLSGMTYPFTIGGILSEITSTYGHAFDTGNISSALLAQKIYTWDYKAGYTLRSLIGDIAEASCTFVQCDYTLNSFDFKTLAERVPTIELTSDNYRNRTTSTYEVPRPTQVQVRTSDKIVTATVSGQTAKDTNLYVIDGNPIFENMSETDIAVHVHNMAASIVGNIYYYVNKCDVVDNYVTATKTSYINLGDIITVDGGKKTIVTSISYSSSGFTIKCDGEESPYVTETQTGIKRIGTLTWDAYTAVGSASSINTTVQFVKAAGKFRNRRNRVFSKAYIFFSHKPNSILRDHNSCPQYLLHSKQQPNRRIRRGRILIQSNFNCSNSKHEQLHNNGNII